MQELFAKDCFDNLEFSRQLDRMENAADAAPTSRLRQKANRPILEMTRRYLLNRMGVPHNFQTFNPHFGGKNVGGRLKTGQWWSIQNQPLNWLVTGLELCWQDAFWCWDGNSAGMFLRVISESEERANANRTQNAVTTPCAEIGQSKF
jgi:hypothetical protein